MLFLKFKNNMKFLNSFNLIFSFLTLTFAACNDIECQTSSLTCGGYCEDSKCVGGYQCPSQTPHCDNYYCVECLADQHCPHACNIYENKCVQCNSNFDCTFDSFRAICNTERNECIQCKNREDCDRDSKCGSTCDGERCTGGIDCESQGLHCQSDYEDLYPAKCVNCSHNGHCGDGLLCVRGECRECLNTPDCNSQENCGNTCANYTCVDNSSLNCSESGTLCDVFIGKCVVDTADTSVNPTTNNSLLPSSLPLPSNSSLSSSSRYIIPNVALLCLVLLK